MATIALATTSVNLDSDETGRPPTSPVEGRAGPLPGAFHIDYYARLVPVMPAVHPPGWLPLAVRPLGNGYYDVNSKSVAGVTYRVDLVWERCSCPDWTCRRSKAALGTKQRWCIHILVARAVPPDDAATPKRSAA